MIMPGHCPAAGRAYQAALKEYFPAIDDFRRETLEEDTFDLVYDAAGELLGVMASTAVQGYDGPISYNLAVDKEGKILAMRIVEHSETQGVGDVIEKPQFQEQFIGKSYLDPLQPGEDVDTIRRHQKHRADDDSSAGFRRLPKIFSTLKKKSFRYYRRARRKLPAQR